LVIVYFIVIAVNYNRIRVLRGKKVFFIVGGLLIIKGFPQYQKRKRRFVSTFIRLVEVMRRLRGERGCPWDREQNHDTLKPYLIEETYEVLDAIDKKNDAFLKEELGDLLLQIVFHAQIAAEEGRFTIDEVSGSIVEKLERRHPHVFGEVKVKGSDEVLKNWEQIKKEEGKKSVLSGVPAGLPSLLRARRVQEKAKRVGFDWTSIDGVMEKVVEEIRELKEAAERGDSSRVEEEFGDLLFTLVNFSRFLHIDAEDSLRRTIDRFTERFQKMERRAVERGKKPLDQFTLEEMDKLWEEAKDG
jgi:tetrapyrrole methylase family protein / MazG family protein